jgi:hypothetical protein
VQADGYYLGSYPTQKQNGILQLGAYSQSVSVKIGVKQETLVKEMSVIVMENERTEQAIGQTPTLGLRVKKGKMKGEYTATESACVFLAVPYDEGLSLKINGKSAKLYEVYGGWTAFYLEEGVNKITLSFCPQGFVVGIVASLTGVALAVLGIWLFKRYGEKVPLVIMENIAYYGAIVAGLAVVCVIYVVPMILCAL